MLKYHYSKPFKNFIGLVILVAAASVAIAAPNLEKWNINEDLKISNQSKNNLSFSIDSICLDKIGLINAHSVKVIPRRHINKACQTNPAQCKTEIYPTANCSGSSIVTLIFDVTGWGVISIEPHSNDYHVGANGFNLFVKGPWV